ncbi:MAG: hypothetical protein AMJ78_05700 [Omnitrophica WOR_2 bacterium SM23_29]|nr:MAG: hypothetical protein AMJ78_05700 [Omnitrophica WOR_2 bacterium SM23_29]
MKRPICLTLVVSCIFIGFVNFAFCEEPMSIELEKIVVTPLGVEQPYEKISRSMDVISFEELESSYSQLVSEPLDRLTSSTIVNYGSLGASKTLRLRGSTAAQVLVLLDSRPINDPHLGQPELHQIPIEIIDRIEVIKGPASAIYGSSAIGGVVNIITKKSSEKPKFVYESRLGTFETFHESFSHSARIKDLGYYLNYTFDSSLGHRDNSQYRAHNWTSKFDYRVTEDNRLSFNAGYFEDEAGTPGKIVGTRWDPNHPDLDDFQFNFKNYLDLGWTAQVFENANINLRSYQNVDRLEFVESYNPLLKDTATSKVRGLVVQYDQEFFDFYKVIFGFDGKDNKLNSSNVGKHRYVVRSPFLQNEVSIGQDMNLNFGARWDNYSNFGKETTHNVGLTYRITDGAKLRANYSKGFRAPTFSDLYWPFDGFCEGNPNLRPEIGWSWEGGFDLEYTNGLEISGTYFTNKLKDLINWAPGENYVWRPTNVDSADIDGIEFKIILPLLNGLSADLGYTYLNAMDRNRDRYLTYRAKNKYDFGLTYEYDSRFNIKFYGQSLGRRYIDTANSEFLQEDLITYLDASYKINNNLTTTLSIDNILNKRYQRVVDYPMPGLTITGGIKAEF